MTRHEKDLAGFRCYVVSTTTNLLVKKKEKEK